MAINRRHFLQCATSAALLSSFSHSSYAQLSQNQEWIIGSSRLSKDQYALSAIDLNGFLKWQLPLPARGHDTVIHSSHTLGVVIARRPGKFIYLFSPQTGALLQQVEVPDTLKLNGHAVWHNNTLIVSAADVASSQMRLLVFHLNSDNQVQHQSTISFDYLGPHEMIKVNDTLVVAIGGLKTDERTTLNKHDFNSGVLTLNLTDLSIRQFAPAPTQHVSLRHLAANAEGTVFVAGQYQLEPKNSEPLLFTLTDTGYTPFPVVDTMWAQLQGYIGSILCHDDTVVASSPRAHWLGWFDQNSLSQTHQILTPDVCALAATSNGIIAGTGTGRCFYNGEMLVTHVIWDNHFVSFKADSVI